MSFGMGTVESVLTEAERSALSTDANAELCTPKQPVMRKLSFKDADSPIATTSPDSSPIEASQSLPMYAGYYEAAMEQDDSDNEFEEMSF